MFGWELPAQASPELGIPTPANLGIRESLGAEMEKITELSYSPEKAAAAQVFFALQV